MMDRQDQEGPSPGTLGDDCQETWVDSTEVVVLDAACDWHAIIAALLGGGLTEHVAELGAAVLRTPCHLREEREEREDGGEGGEGGQSRRIISHSYGDGVFYTPAPLSQEKSKAMGDVIDFTKRWAALALDSEPVSPRKKLVHTASRTKFNSFIIDGGGISSLSNGQCMSSWASGALW